jgi:dipeptidyl aminopeptidase/acylaminoacyl peptidase
MRCRKGSGKSRYAVLLLVAAALTASGCLQAGEEISIQPLPTTAGRADPGLGPGTRSLTSGPGYKGSPSWSPGGGRIAFTVDGYVVDKALESDDFRRWTNRGFAAEDAEWVSGDDLTILGAVPGSTPTGADEERFVYWVRAAEDSFDLKKIATGVLAMSPESAERGGLIFAIGGEPYESRLMMTRGSGEVDRVFEDAVGGRITAISSSSDGRKLVLAVRPPGDRETSELGVFDLRIGEYQRKTRLEGDLEILGTPQWTRHGLYFVAGRDEPSEGTEAPYDLYRAPTGPGVLESAPGVGKDFVAASVRVSPDGKRLAVIGRLNPKSPANLYVLDVFAENFRSVTTSEDMEIKTGPDDLAWSPDGRSVAIVARGTPSTEPEVRPAPAQDLLEDFYNLYEIPVEGTEGTPR